MKHEQFFGLCADKQLLTLTSRS